MFNLRKKLPPALPPGAATRELRGDGWHVRLDLTPQVLSLSIPKEATSKAGEEELAPTCQGLNHGFISASMLAVKAKLFDDGLYAGTELSAQSLKRKLLTPLVRVAPAIAAAARLGGMDAPSSAEADRITVAFSRISSRPSRSGFTRGLTPSFAYTSRTGCFSSRWIRLMPRPSAPLCMLSPPRRRCTPPIWTLLRD